ncbi:hypothetical protein CYMTET_52791 [Cymbomonas tetramitiformis]|uniref:Uncharacterized protein n=1 Tax=Cymbomonas tetramitiformis TaxID=36881 RepID=A0AAE0BJQ8_9CHLO|nr:hypothetical protein CYMTET_52791 [Cymbomonas tetramitiformis]
MAGGSDSQKTKGDKELARRQTLPYCPYREDNPYPTRPATLESRMPQLYDLYSDKMLNSLNKKALSSLKYKQLVLGPALAYFYDDVQFSADTLELLENQDKVPASTQEIEQRVYETHNTMLGVFTLLAQRYSMLQLRASLDGDAAAHGGPEALKAKLAFMEEKVYNNSDGFTNEPIFNQWLQESETSRQCAVMNTTAKQAARGGASGGGGRFQGQERRDDGDGGSNPKNTIESAWTRTRKRAQTGPAVGLALGVNVPDTVLPWIGQKVEPSLMERVRRRKGAWRVAGANAEQTWLEKEAKRHVDNGAGVKTKEREWLNAFCWQSRCKMETLKKLQRLAKQNDWCFFFDLKDGYQCVGINPDFQKYMQFDVQGELY